MSTLTAREGYRLWAPLYEPETAVSSLEDRVARTMMPSLSGRRLLDVGCGTGRRLHGSGAALAVGVDLTPEMLFGPGKPDDSWLLTADLRALPFARASFDVVWCRLVIGHLEELLGSFTELARVCRAGGVVIVTDFHPAAAAAGHRRTFRDGTGRLHEIEHHPRSPETLVAAAAAAGLEPVERVEGRVGPDIRSFYERSGRLAAYAEQEGLPLVLGLSFRRGRGP